MAVNTGSKLQKQFDDLVYEVMKHGELPPIPGEVVEVGSERYYELRRYQAQQAVANGPAGLRDQLAMAALTGLLASSQGAVTDYDLFARRAYRAADEMLKARDG